MNVQPTKKGQPKMTQESLSIGKAVYFEFCKPETTTQILITPEGYSSVDANVVTVSMYRRRISTLHKRRTWRYVASSTTFKAAVDANATGPVPWSAIISGGHGSVACNVILAPLVHSILDSMVSNSYKLRIAPVIVEVTAEDLVAVRLCKTPYKILGRVWKARKAMGFPVGYFAI